MTESELNDLKNKIKKSINEVLNIYGYEFYSEEIVLPDPSSKKDQEIIIQFVNVGLSLRIYFGFSISFTPLPNPETYGNLFFQISIWDHVNNRRNGFFPNLFYRRKYYNQYVINRSLKDQTAEDYIDESINKFRMACDDVLKDFITGKRFEEHTLEDISGPEGWKALQNALYEQQSEIIFGKRKSFWECITTPFKKIFK